MCKALYATFAVLVVLLLFVLLKALRAETAEHHGFMVIVEETTSGCLSCHDGSAAQSVANCSGVDCRISDSHSVDIPYPPPGKENEYQPVAYLTEARIKLINDQISCISCHDLKNPAGLHLVMDNAGSNLCFGCHIK
ncbi:cytochrome c3 family protein [Geotalea toluenoxydans]|uniref:cytochrome c3 family protein n=1 Tax=Geotalea toluenoxydans TaxID=421624 RepID=UPI0006CF8F8D|nr:cytochrome c3 family protein [Geotalea toluenoxydans]